MTTLLITASSMRHAPGRMAVAWQGREQGCEPRRRDESVATRDRFANELRAEAERAAARPEGRVELHEEVADAPLPHQADQAGVEDADLGALDVQLDEGQLCRGAGWLRGQRSP